MKITESARAGAKLEQRKGELRSNEQNELLLQLASLSTADLTAATAASTGTLVVGDSAAKRLHQLPGTL